MLVQISCSLLLAALLCCSQAWAAAFSFTAIPDQDTTRLQKRFNNIADYLSTRLSTRVTYIPVKSYAASVAAFKNKQVQLARFGGLSGVKTRQAVPGSRAIAQGEEDLGFQTYFIAASSSGLQPADTLPQDIRGLTFTFGSIGSTSGRLMPEYYLRQQFGQSPGQLFKRVGFSGAHSKTVALVQSGAYQLGAVNFKVWQREVKEGKVDPAKVLVIWAPPKYPDYNWTIGGMLVPTMVRGLPDRYRRRCW